MKHENIGSCPGCYDLKNRSRMVDIYVVRDNNGGIANMYIFGDDDFDMISSDCNIEEFKVSEDGKTITEIVCPRCKERIAVEVPVIKIPVKEEKKFGAADLYADFRARQNEKLQ